MSTYIKLWEEDLSQEKFSQAETPLWDKILSQITVMGARVSEDHRCWVSQVVPLHYGLVRSGEIKICHPFSGIMGQALTSPLMVSVLLILAFLWVWQSRREANHRQQTQKLEMDLQLERELVVFSRQIAHDIRSPLTALKTLAGISQGVSSDFRDLLRASVGRLQSIADELLEKKVETSTTGFQIPVRFEVLHREWRLSYPQIDIQLRGVLQGVLHVEAAKLERILSNIVANAAEASATKIELFFDANRDRFLIEIRDNGRGFAPEVLKRLGQRGVSSKAKGHGLGLSDAIETLKNWKGSVEVRPETHGSLITLLLPGDLFKRDA